MRCPMRTLAGSSTVLQTGGTDGNTVNVSSMAPTAGGIVDNIQGALTILGNGLDTLNVDDTGSTIAKTATLTSTTLTGMSMGSERRFPGRPFCHSIEQVSFPSAACAAFRHD